VKNTLKVAEWEIKRNLRNKAFIISILLTPFLMLIFGLLPTLLAKFETEQDFTVYVRDELGLFEEIDSQNLGQFNLILTTDEPETIKNKIQGNKNQAFINIDQKSLTEGIITVYTDSEGQGKLSPLNQLLDRAIKNQKLKSFGLTDSDIASLDQPYRLNIAPLSGDGDQRTTPEKIIPAVFAGILFLAVFTSGTMIFQSALQEKKDKMVELILSSIKAEELMQGKILGYFVLGLIQVGVWLLFGIPAAQLYFKIPILKYLLVPDMLPMLFFALAGYLLYSALFVAIGATMEDAQSGSSFQSIVILIPMLPLFVIGPIIVNPSGFVALVGTYFPLTTPGVMLARLSLSQHIASWEIILSGAILVLTVLLMMKLAGKLFKVAILMYGKNATFKEVVKWLRY
jgi:ABC-2 type transport system permease protein